MKYVFRLSYGKLSFHTGFSEFFFMHITFMYTYAFSDRCRWIRLFKKMRTSTPESPPPPPKKKLSCSLLCNFSATLSFKIISWQRVTWRHGHVHVKFFWYSYFWINMSVCLWKTISESIEFFIISNVPLLRLKIGYF